MFIVWLRAAAGDDTRQTSCFKEDVMMEGPQLNTDVTESDGPEVATEEKGDISQLQKRRWLSGPNSLEEQSVIYIQYHASG